MVSVPFPVVAAQEVVVADLPAVVGQDLAGEDSRRRDSDRVDRAGRVIGLVRYCPVVAVDTVAIRPFADCTAEAAAPTPAAADDPRTVHPVPAAHPAAVAAVRQTAHPEVAAAAAPRLDRSYWDSDAAVAAAAAGADVTGAGSSGWAFGRVVVADRDVVAAVEGACTGWEGAGLGGSSSRVCRRLPSGSGRTGRARLGACSGRGDNAGTAGVASAVGRTSGAGDAAGDAALGAAGDGGACPEHHHLLCCWPRGPAGLDRHCW